ncbi:hypothetical protein FSP39_003060 [Pinctada imbricata]|uniref:Fibrinogen C-terminal domain-containing protein n=1 Tax=Pinctada imbricata TaxID=66713 RepID=A0AA88XKY9_PINIB|nr:hypothetical protein FSP39_003060 [Pinctada imbricata]
MDLLFILESKANREKHKFKYKNFKVGNEANNFEMTFDFYPEYLDDDFKDHLPYKQLCNEDETFCHNNTNFSTYNKDHTGNKCPQIYGGGWWYNKCHHVSLTGDRDLYLGYRWKYLNGSVKDEGLLKNSVMMIRPTE